MSGALVSGRMMQPADILAMNSQELNEYLRKLELENPLVELRGGQDYSTERLADVQRKLEWLDRFDEQNRVYYEQDAEDEEDPEDWRVPVDPEDNLADFVCAQILPSCPTEKDRDVIYFLANLLDEDGYLREDIRQLEEKLNLQTAEAQRYLYQLQSVDPAGIGARNLRECLLLQLDRLPLDMVIARRIVLECLDLLGENRIAKIAIRLGISLEEAEENCQVIRHLNPKPGSGFSARENLRYLEPDVTVVRFQDYYQVVLNDHSSPRIHTNGYYKKLMKDPNVSSEVVDYISSQLSQARWVRSAVEARGEYLVELTKILVREQSAFFEKGTDYRRHLSLETVMKQIGLGEEELKALCKDKYVQCHWGIFPMIFLMFRADSVLPEIQKLRDEDPVVQAKQAIRHIISQEDKRHPASDQKITNRLAEMGITISRRTVAKYRAQMGFRDASGRREWPDEQ